MPTFEPNYVAIVAAAIAYFALGGLWYSPLFGSMWRKLQGWSEEDLEKHKQGMATSFAVTFLAGVVMAGALSYVLQVFGAAGYGNAALVAIVVWLGFAGTTQLTNIMYSGKPKALFPIDSGYPLVGLILMALIFTAWM